MYSVLIPFIIFLIMLFVAQYIIDKANTKLEEDKRTSITALLTNTKKFTFGILISIIILFYFNLQFDYIKFDTNLLIYFILTSGVIAISGNISFKKLKENDYPKFYIKSYLISSSIIFFALVVIFALLKL